MRVIKDCTIEKILSNVKRNENGCWIWQRKVCNYGHPTFNMDGSRGRVDKVLFEYFDSKIPNDSQKWRLYSICEVGLCVNPDHHFIDLKNSETIAIRNFWRQVNTNGPIIREELGQCWNWSGKFISDNGYGRFYYNYKFEKANRIAWKFAYGQTPKLLVLHKCDNKLCVRIDHLWIGTQSDNMRDMDRKGRRVKGVNKNPKRGSNHPMSKIDENIAKQVKFLLGERSLSKAAIARKLSISYNIVNNIDYGYSWGHI